MKITLREMISSRGWEQFRINTRIRTSDSYILCEKISFYDSDIQSLLDNLVYDYAISSSGQVTWYVQD